MKGRSEWYVIQVLTGTEQSTATVLSAAGMRAIAPAEVLHERRHGRWWPIRRTVFPGYVFVHAEMRDRVYYYIKRLPHVIRLLGANGPEPVPDEQMETVLLFSPQGRDFDVSQAERSDGKTIITSGPLYQMQEQIVKISARARRATLAVPLLGDTYQVDVGVVVTQQDTQESAGFPTDSNPTEDAR